AVKDVRNFKRSADGCTETMLNITWLGSISAIQGIGSSVQRVISNVVISRAVWTIDVETIARAATASSETTATKEQRATAETTPTKSAAWASETSWNKTTGATARTTGATARTTGSSLAAEKIGRASCRERE